MSAVSAQDFDDHGQVEECLKTMLKQGKLRDNQECLKVRISALRPITIHIHHDY